MDIFAKVNGQFDAAMHRDGIQPKWLHEVKSSYGKIFYGDDKVLSVEVECSGITFLKLEKNPETLEVITRISVDSNTL